MLFKRLEQGRKLRPAGDTLEHDTVLLREGGGGGAVLDGLLQVLLQQLKGLGGGHLAAGGVDSRTCRYDVSHVVEQVEAAVRRRLVLKVITDL